MSEISTISELKSEQQHTFRDGLLCKLAFAGTGCFFMILARVAAGDRRTRLATLAVLASLFSWELEGSMASLLGTGVMVVVRLDTSIEFDLVVVSFRHCGEASLLCAGADLVEGDGVAPLAEPAAPDLEKKPRMLCCLPVEGAFLTVDGVFAGVRAVVAAFSPILSHATNARNKCSSGEKKKFRS